MIFIENLNFDYGDGPVLKDVNLHCHAGESVGIIGASGAGKSTLLKLLVGLEAEYSGTIRICGQELNKKNLSQVRRHIGYVFQDSDSQLFMTRVEEDIAFAPRNYGFNQQEVQQRVRQAMAKVHIEHLKGRGIHKLSGGEKKLASIATILSTEPEVILMDEPSAALDPKNRRNLIKVINQLEELKIIASHDLDFIMDTCRRVILIKEGRIIKDGEAEVILRDRELLEECGLELPLSLSRYNE